jgi:hypothetical protein
MKVVELGENGNFVAGRLDRIEVKYAANEILRCLLGHLSGARQNAAWPHAVPMLSLSRHHARCNKSRRQQVA